MYSFSLVLFSLILPELLICDKPFSTNISLFFFFSIHRSSPTICSINSLLHTHLSPAPCDLFWVSNCWSELVYVSIPLNRKKIVWPQEIQWTYFERICWLEHVYSQVHSIYTSIQTKTGWVFDGWEKRIVFEFWVESFFCFFCFLTMH